MITNIFQTIFQEFHSFGVYDFLSIGTLVLLESLLSVDNAIVLAILVRALPKEQRRKALMYGMVGAFVFRIFALIAARWFMNLWFFQTLGGGYLLFLSMKHMFFFFKEDAHQSHPQVSQSFWKTIVAVELTDVVFSLDSITTGVAVSDKITIIWIGGILGILCLRFLSNTFIALLDKLPKLEDLAYQIVFFVGIKLTLGAFNIHLPQSYFWMMMALILILGASLIWRDHYQKKNKIQHYERLLLQFENGEMQLSDLLALEYIPSKVIAYLRERGYLSLQETKQRD